jgi:hypothetical protein
MRDLQSHAEEVAHLAPPILQALAEAEVGPSVMDFLIPVPGTVEQRIRISPGRRSTARPAAREDRVSLRSG